MLEIILGVPKVLLTVAAISLLILVHELGHFIMAKVAGMEVEILALGFWKKIFSFRIGETEYRLCVIPLGGYVKIAGEGEEGKEAAAPEEDADAEQKEDPYWSKTVGQRALFITGGVAMNFLLAIVLFAVAFFVGVPFTAAEVGELTPGSPAWRAGIRPGDQIVSVRGAGGLEAGFSTPLTFEDFGRVIALGRKGDSVDVVLKGPDGERKLTLEPEYDEMVGMMRLGIDPPREAVVSALVKRDAAGRCPAEVAGVEVGDRIVAVNGIPVTMHYELVRAHMSRPHGPTELTVERHNERGGVSTLNLTVELERALLPRVGISGSGTVIESLRPGAGLTQWNLQAGDRITQVDGEPVGSSVVWEKAMWDGVGGSVVLTVQRGDEPPVEHTVDIPQPVDVVDITTSVWFEMSTTLTWVREGSPAGQAGLRAGDRIVSVAGAGVSAWQDVVREGNAAGSRREYIYERDGQEHTVALEAVMMPSELGFMGIQFNEFKRMPVRESNPLRAVALGIGHTVQSIDDALKAISRFARRDMSTKNMGGIIMIAQVSHSAAGESFGKLLFMTAMISAAIAFMNILPIPVLDGGHLLFLLIEWIRGRRVSDAVMINAQKVGLIVLLLLVAFVTYNDIHRLLR
jgi:regulator of sigma E protease